MIKRLMHFLLACVLLSQPAYSAVPTVITDVSATASSNSPQGSDTIGTSLSGFLRAAFAFERQIFDTSIIYGGTATGTNTITVTLSPVPLAYKAGQGVAFIAAGANTGAVTINENSLGAKNLYKNGSTALTGGEIPAAGALVIAIYDGTQFQLSNFPTSGALLAANNLSDIVTPATALTNIGGIGAATSNTLTNKTIDTATNTVKLAGTTITAKSGTTGVVVTAAAGAKTSGHLATWDSNSNVQDGGVNTAYTLGTSITLNPYATSSTGTQAHGLGGTCNMIIAYLENISTEAGYAVGERVPLIGTSAATGFSSITMSCDSTNIYYNTNPSDLPDIINKSGFARQAITPSKWKVVMTPVIF